MTQLELETHLTLLNWLFPIFLFLLMILGFLGFIVRKHIVTVIKKEQEKAQLRINYQKELLVNSIEIQETERARIAADLHDDLIAQLQRINFMNDNAGLQPLLKTAITRARGISHDLTPPLLNELYLRELIQDFLHPFEKKYTIDFNFSGEQEQKLDKIKKLHIFRIFQEVMTNIIKHAQANSIEITLQLTNELLSLLIKDDGIGFDTQKLKKGLGSKNLELRTQLLKGDYHITSVPNQGTTFTLTIKKPTYDGKKTTYYQSN